MPVKCNNTCLQAPVLKCHDEECITRLYAIIYMYAFSPVNTMDSINIYRYIKQNSKCKEHWAYNSSKIICSNQLHIYLLYKLTELGKYKL